MTLEIKVPTLPESVSDATVVKIYKQKGDAVMQDDNLIDLETDKVMLEIPATASGVIVSLNIKEGDVVTGGQILGALDTSAQPAQSLAAESQVQSSAPEKAKPATDTQLPTAPGTLSPAVKRVLQNAGVQSTQGIVATGKNGRVTKEDAAQFVLQKNQGSAVNEGPSSTVRRVPMSRLRAKVAERLVQVQQEAALLTTFNEVNMQPVMDLRNRYKVAFEKKHGVRLGFMSFFTKAAVEALKQFPTLNASVDGQDILYHDTFDIGIAIGSPRGLVVPVLRQAQSLSLADMEKQIRAYAEQAKTGKLKLEDLQGGTFTITNGGVFGSMLSTPILNPPQSGILGMHAITERAVVENGAIVARPMMYLALSYDHRIVDGRESVSFLVAIKQMLEDPARLILGL